MASMKKTKKCAKCDTEKSNTEFHKGYNTCKECHKATVKASRNKHYKKFRRYQKRYYYSNSEKVERWTNNYRERYEIEHGISYSQHQYELVKARMESDPKLVERKKQEGKRHRDRHRKSINSGKITQTTNRGINNTIRITKKEYCNINDKDVQERKP